MRLSLTEREYRALLKAINKKPVEREDHEEQKAEHEGLICSLCRYFDYGFSIDFYEDTAI